MGRTDCCSGGQSSVNLQSTLLLMGGFGFPSCWLFGLRQLNTGAYQGSLVRLMADSGRSHSKEYFQELGSSWKCPWPHGETQPSPTSAGDPPTLTGRSGSVSCGVTAPSPVSNVHTTFCVPSKRGVFVSPSPVKVLQSNTASLQSLIL